MEQSTEQQAQPTIITLDNNNSVQILVQYVELAQQKGAFVLAEAELLKRVVEFLLNNVPDKDLNELNAKQLLIQAVHKGQRSGAYTLNDAALLHKVVQFVSGQLQAQQPQVQQQQPQAQEQQPQVQQEQKVEPEQPSPVASSSAPAPVQFDEDDLSQLAEPIPLKPKEI